MAKAREIQNVWITGASSGIGLSLARKLDGLGHHVAISARRAKELTQIAENGQNISAYPLDICDAQAVASTVIQISRKKGPIDLAILNAGTYVPGAFADTEIDDFRTTMETNYFGTIHCIKSLLPQMKTKGARIAIVASLSGYRGLPNANGYGPSKAALISLSESLRAEFADSNIEFILINPGFIETPLTNKNNFEMPYLIDADQAADEIILGLERRDFEIAFPKPLVRRLKMLRILPYRWYFRLMRKFS
jgi:short-subunit dehydrogenase